MTARAGAASAADRRRTLAIVGRVLPAWARRRFGVLATLAIALVCGIGSANVLDAEFVAGDLQFIVENPAIRRPDVLVTAFTRGYWWVGGDADAGSYYRPLLVLTDALDFAVWGPRSLGFHLTSTLLYIVACALVFALARAVTRSPFAAIGAALVFAAHPIHAHATSYVSARSTVLCAAFYVGALVAALRFRRDAARGRARGRDLAVALGCYAGGLLTLEAAVTLPIALAVVLWPSRRVARAPLVRFAAAVVGVSAAYLVARRLALGGVLSHKQDLWELLSPIATALTMAKTVAWYLVKLFAPTDLSYVPPFLPVLDARDATGWASLALVVALAGFALAGPRRFGRERAAVGLALVTLAPVSGVLPLDHFVKGHYAFLPSIALAVVLALALRRAMRAAAASRGRGGAVAGLGVAVGAIVTAGVIGTLFANEAWQSPDALNARVIELEPEIPDAIFAHPVMTRTANRFGFVHFNVATVLARAGRCPEALPEVRRARWLTRQRSMKLRSDLLEAHCLFVGGDTARALEAYRPLVDAAPTDPIPPARAAWIHLQAGETAEALPLLARACDRGDAAACQTRARLAQAPAAAP